jgi:predicted nuclease of predicted toxin-antitoxin system
MVLADEGLNGKIVAKLRNLDVDVTWILEESPGISDKEVIDYVKSHGKILITEDKDFGEWVFAHKIEGVTIIFLRYGKSDFEQVLNFLSNLIPSLLQSTVIDQHKFITINKNKVRRRSI